MVFVHIFTFFILLHAYGLMQHHTETYSETTLWFIAALTLLHIVLAFYRVSRFTRSIRPQQTITYEDYIP